MKSSKIVVHGRRVHGKALEEYVGVTFVYGSKSFEWDIPIEYPRTGTHLGNVGPEEIDAYIEEVYNHCHPDNWVEFRKEQNDFWKDYNAPTTKEFFDVLVKDFGWKSMGSDFPPNDNPAARIKDLKMKGFTIATRTWVDPVRNKRCNRLLLLPIPRGGITGYETWTKETRTRIISTLGGIDAYEGKPGNVAGLLPDHKFPEVRWDASVRRDDLSGLTETEIRSDFQLLTNQRNLQKREVCRGCLQSGQRGYPFGIAFFYEGGSSWDLSIPTRGPEAEEGCIGCGWYDFEAWRSALNKRMSNQEQS